MPNSTLNVVLDDSFINKLFELTDEIPPSYDNINIQVLKKQLHELGVIMKSQENEINLLKENLEKANKYRGSRTESTVEAEKDLKAQNRGFPQANNSSELKKSYIEPKSANHVPHEVYDEEGTPCKGRVLVIDDLGVITYQLRMAFKKAGFYAVTSREIVDAIKQFKKVPFDLVIMDLFIPTEREGYILLDALRNISMQRNDNAVLAVMSASSTKDHRLTCTKHGAAFFVEKCDNWQKELFSYVQQYVA